MNNVPMARWPLQALQEQLGAVCPGMVIEIVPQVDSTSAELMRRARAGQMQAVLLLAQRQTAGHGRMGRAWHSAPDASLTFSLGLPMALPQWGGLSLAIGVAVMEGLLKAAHASGAALAEGAFLGLKWPNDVWLCRAQGNGKLAGILVETSMTADARAASGAVGGYLVAGIGINIRPVHVPDLQALSAPPAAARDFCPALDAPLVLQYIAPETVLALRLFAAKGFAAFHSRFDACDILRGRAVNLLQEEQIIASGTACGVDGQGALLVQTPQGLSVITSAGVSVRLR